MHRGLLLLPAAALFTAACAHAEPPHHRDIAPEVMEKVRACATAKGIDLPAPPPHEKGDRAAPPSDRNDRARPPQDGKGPRLTEEQRAALDACFRDAGIEPPAPPRH